MKKLWLLLSIFVLSACGARYEGVQSKATDEIHTLLIENKKLYVLGKTYDYEFDDPALSEDLPKFLNSNYANKLFYISLIFKISANSEVFGGYALYLKPDGLSEKDKTQIKQLGFKQNARREVDHKMLEQLGVKWEEQEQLWVKTYGYSYAYQIDDKLAGDTYLDKPNGKLVKVANRQDLLQKYSLKPALPVQLIFTERKTDTTQLALGVAAPILAAPFVVVTLPISLPLMTMCLINSANGGGGCK